MKKLLLFAILFMIFFKVDSQTTFNHRIDFDAFATILTNIIPMNEGYLGIGIIADDAPPFLSGNLFAKFDEYGNLLWAKSLHSQDKTIDTWENTLTHFSNENLIASGSSNYNDGIKTVFFIKYTLEGDTIGFKEFFHPFLPQYEIVNNKDFRVTLSGDFVFSTRLRGKLNNPDDTDYYIFKTDSLGIIKWDTIIGNSRWDVPMSMIIDDATGNIISGGSKSNRNTTTENYQYQTHIFALDSLGNELWTYLSPIADGLRDGARDMILLDDGSLIVASGIGYEQDWPSVNFVFYEKSVFKLNANQELEWEVSFPEDTITGSAKTTNLINLSDESGFIVAGTDGDFNNDTFQLKGWLAKLSYDGDMLWERKYLHIDLENRVSFHEFFDVKETADGGLILCGESQDFTGGAEIPQQAWLLKLDQHGCLIPGCHLIDDVHETETVSYELKLYPNPTSDYLNIFMRHHRGKKAFTFRILNGIGQEMTVFEQDIQEETLMIDLARYGSGVYYLEVSQEGRILETEKFVVKK